MYACFRFNLFKYVFNSCFFFEDNETKLIKTKSGL